jgi:hypothetical protein
MKLYICVLDEVPDHIVPTLVAHAVLAAHIEFSRKYIVDEEKYSTYLEWLQHSFKKCVCMVNRKEFNKIAQIEDTFLAHENTTLNGEKSCAVVLPRKDNPNVIKFAKLWKPLEKLT